MPAEVQNMGGGGGKKAITVAIFLNEKNDLSIIIFYQVKTLAQKAIELFVKALICRS